MPSFGPWITEPDWDYIDQYDTNDPERLDARDTEILAESGWLEGDGSGVPPYLVTEENVRFAVLAAQGGNGNAYGRMRYGWNYDLSYPDWNSKWSARALDTVFQVSPPSGGFYFSEGVADPEDAIGIEYEGRGWDPADPWSYEVDTVLGADHIISASLGYRSYSIAARLNGSFVDDSGRLDGYPNNDLTSPSTTKIIAIAAGNASEVASITVGPEAGSKTVNLIGTYPLPISAAEDWSCSLLGRTEFIPPRRAPDALPISSGTVSYGVRMYEVSIAWNLRALPYRWVYGNTPIRQTSHRDDHLAGGAYQTWPAPTSDQLSNTTFGGYL